MFPLATSAQRIATSAFAAAIVSSALLLMTLPVIPVA